MSVILLCRKLLKVNLKPILSVVVSGFKIHTSFPRGQLLKCQNPGFISTRHISKWFRKAKKNELKQIDDIPDQYKLIFRNTMERYIFYTQLGTSITTTIIVLIVLATYGSPKSELTFYGNTKIKPTCKEEDAQLYLAFFFAAVVLLQLMITKMPLRIYYLRQQKKYIFIFPSNLPFQSKMLTCKIGEVEKLPLKGIMPWRDSNFRIKNQKNILMIEDHFRSPADLYIMLGVQRDPEQDT